MFNVCPACGQYSVSKEITLDGPAAVCPYCGHAHPFLRLPLFVITGASGTGKSTIGLRLVEELRGESVVMETDILWRPEFATPEDGYRSYRELWLRVAKNIGQAGLPVVLVGAAIPEQLEGVSERRYFSTIHYHALVCDDEDLIARLKDRPAWRDSGSEEFVGQMLRFNRWLQENARHTDPPMAVLDTSRSGIEDGVRQLAARIRQQATGSAVESMDPSTNRED